MKRRESQEIKEFRVEDAEAGKSRVGVHHGNAESISGGVRHTSIDKPLVDLPKR